MAITVTDTDDMVLVKSVLGDKDIWLRFSDGANYDDCYPKNDSHNKWLKICCDNDIAGVILLKVESSCSISFHPFMYKCFRQHGREMAKQFFKWFIECAPESVIKINICTPECFKSVINMSRKVGFKHEGTMRDSYMLDGKVYNKVMSGMTRKEVEKWAV